jgi:tetratricopeptide (TPR) repeat protein
MASPRALLATTVLAGGLFVWSPITSAQYPQLQRPAGFDQIQNWFRLSRQHASGTIDDAVKQAAMWPPVTYQNLIDDMQLVRLLVLQANRLGIVASSSSSSNTKPVSAEIRGRRMSLEQLGPILGLTTEATGGPLTAESLAKPDTQARRAIAQVMMRAMLLQTDVAMVAPEDLPAAAGSRMMPSAVQLRDGRASAVGNIAVHYALAREAAALVMSASDGMSVARQWYFATLAYLQNGRNYAALLPHLETARITMPADAKIWLWSGVAYENLGAPPIQVAADELSARIETPSLLYARAEGFLRHALELDPVCPECWLRLGRVEQLSGNDDEAATLLARAESQLTSPELKYYAALFAGRAAESLNNIDAARSGYVRAMALFPQAQSPRLALAELAFRNAEQDLALSGVRTMFITAGNRRNGDPWWNYDVSLVANWQELGDGMRKAAAALLEAR